MDELESADSKTVFEIEMWAREEGQNVPYLDSHNVAEPRTQIFHHVPWRN